jgi:hypothetical protein
MLSSMATNLIPCLPFEVCVRESSPDCTPTLNPCFNLTSTSFVSLSCIEQFGLLLQVIEKSFSSSYHIGYSKWFVSSEIYMKPLSGLALHINWNARREQRSRVAPSKVFLFLVSLEDLSTMSGTIDVTKHNIHEVLPTFIRSLSDCEFYALDCEMTGIRNKRSDPFQESPIAFPETVYRAKRIVAMRYHVTQIGVCIFKRLPNVEQSATGEAGSSNKGTGSSVDADADDVLGSVPESTIDASKAKEKDSANLLPRYRCTTFNFHVIPTAGDLVIDRETCQFLRRHNFDFNKWMDYSLPYVAKPPKPQGGNKGKVEASSHSTVASPAVQGATPAAASEGSKSISPVSAPTTAGPSSSAAGPSSEPPADPPSIGFKSVYELLVSSRKPMIGHNCFADILFVSSAFGTPTLKPAVSGDGDFEFEPAKPVDPGTTTSAAAPKTTKLTAQASLTKVINDSSYGNALGEDYFAFKKWVSSQFPLIYDTKRIVTDLRAENFASTHLEALYDIMKDQVVIERAAAPALKVMPFVDPKTLKGDVSVGSPTSGNAGKGLPELENAHQAGYDAMMTGVVFLALRERVCQLVKEDSFEKRYGNQVALFRSLFAMNLNPGHADVYLPLHGACVLTLAPKPTTPQPSAVESPKESSAEAKEASGTTPSAATAASAPPVPEVLDENLIEEAMRAMVFGKDVVKPTAASLKYYKLSRRSAVVHLPPLASFLPHPIPTVEATMYYPPGSTKPQSDGSQGGASAPKVEPTAAAANVGLFRRLMSLFIRR